MLVGRGVDCPFGPRLATRPELPRSVAVGAPALGLVLVVLAPAAPPFAPLPLPDAPEVAVAPVPELPSRRKEYKDEAFHRYRAAPMLTTTLETLLLPRLLGLRYEYEGWGTRTSHPCCSPGFEGCRSSSGTRGIPPSE